MRAESMFHHDERLASCVPCAEQSLANALSNVFKKTGFWEDAKQFNQFK
jgi:hypothetical protein